MLNSNGSFTSTGRAKPAPRPRFTADTEAIDSRHLVGLINRWGWTDNHVAIAGAKWAPSKYRYALPIYSPRGEQRGWVLYSFTQQPKSLTYLDGDGPRLAWYRSDFPGTTTIVVEDIGSAVRASHYVNAVALLGTACNFEAATEIASVNDDVLWCLDDDAFVQGLRLQREHKLLFNRSAVIRPRCDLKDMPEQELKELLEGY